MQQGKDQSSFRRIPKYIMDDIIINILHGHIPFFEIHIEVLVSNALASSMQTYEHKKKQQDKRKENKHKQETNKTERKKHKKEKN